MSDKPTKEELVQQLSEKGIEFEIPDEMLEAVAGGYDPNSYNPAAVADEMRAAIAQAKKSGTSKEQLGELYILRSNAAFLENKGYSPTYQLECDKYRYIMENWDKI